MIGAAWRASARHAAPLGANGLQNRVQSAKDLVETLRRDPRSWWNFDQVGHTTRGRNLWHSASRQSLTLSAQLPLPEAWIRYDICVVVALAIRRQGR